MLNLVVATAFFLALHIVVSSGPPRPWLVARFGERAYLGLFTLTSLGAIVWMVLAFRAADTVPLWSGGAAARHAVYPVVLIAFYLVVAGLGTPSPTAAGAEGLLERGGGPVGVQKVTRHPVLWGIALWALAHMLANGDFAALVFFGGFALLALVGPRLIDAKLAARRGEAWRRYADETSWLPFRALIERRTRLSPAELGWWRPALALALYLAFLLLLHGWLIGVPLVAL